MAEQSLAQTLRALRNSGGYTQETLAKMLHITRQAYGAYESGKNYPDIEKLIRICAFYHIPLETFVPDDLKQTEEFREVTAISTYIGGNEVSELNDDDLALLRKYRCASPEIQALIATVLDQYVQLNNLNDRQSIKNGSA